MSVLGKDVRMAKAEKSKVRVNVIFESEDHARLEDYCEREGHKKSTLIARIVREYLAANAPKPARTGLRRPKAKPKKTPRRTRSSKPTRG